LSFICDLYEYIARFARNKKSNSMKKIVAVLLFVFLNISMSFSQTTFETDIIKTSGNDLKMTFIGHGTLMFEFDGKVIHIDPVGRYTNYSKMPDADLILITHHHGDHLDVDAIGKILKTGTRIICSEKCMESLEEGTIMKNGDKQTFSGIIIEAVPAYNLVHMRKDGNLYHPKV